MVPLPCLERWCCCHLFIHIRYYTYIGIALVDSDHVLVGILPVITFKLMRNPQIGFRLMLRSPESDYMTPCCVLNL
jgi:hypothetical protein